MHAVLSRAPPVAKRFVLGTREKGSITSLIDVITAITCYVKNGDLWPSCCLFWKCILNASAHELVCLCVFQETSEGIQQDEIQWWCMVGWVAPLVTWERLSSPRFMLRYVILLNIHEGIGYKFCTFDLDASPFWATGLFHYRGWPMHFHLSIWQMKVHRPAKGNMYFCLLLWWRNSIALLHYM